MRHPDRDYERQVRRLAQASVWRMRLSEADLESSADFESWLASDPANLAAWKKVQASWRLTEDFTAGPELMAARRDALRRAGGRRWKAHFPLWLFGSLAAAAAVAYFALAAFLSGAREQWVRYETGLAQREALTLPDGTQVTLDAATALEVHYGSTSRSVRLLKGQARFSVVHNAARPFTVRAGPETVLDLGTDFNVNLIGPTVQVALIKGRVSVAADDHADAAPLELMPGQELIASPSTTAYVRPVNLRTVTAWEAGQLVFDDAPVGSVAAVVSRYAEHPIHVNADVTNLRISGVFKEGDVANFVDMMTHYLPVTATTSPDGSIVLSRER